MALQIGRVGIDVALDNPEVWDFNGEIVTVSGELFAATIHDAKVLRQQLIGHVGNPDEPVVPVIWSEDSLADGFYWVLEASVSSVAGSYSAFWFPFAVTLQRIPDYAAPLIESILLSPGARTNDHALIAATVQHWHALPATAIGYSSAGVQANSTTRVSEDGTLNYYNHGSLADAVASFTLPVADWYDGACRLEYDYGDNGTYRVAVGRQVPNLPTDARWRIGNGILRVDLNSTTDFNLGIQRWKTVSYSTSKIFNVGLHAAGEIDPFDAPSALTVLRNSPEEVIVRLAAPSIIGGATVPIPITVDLRLQRGAPYVELQINSWPGDVTKAWGVGRATNEASTTLTGSVVDAGLKATADDADGFRYFIASPYDTTLDTADGDAWITVTAAAASFAVGLADPEAVPPHDDPETHALEYIAAMSETMRVVER